MIVPRLVFLLLQNPDAHYGGGTASGTVAGATTDPAGQLFRFLLSTVPQWVQLAGVFIGGPIAAIVAWQVWKHRRNIWGWFLARSRVYKLTIVASGGFVVLICGFVGLYNYNYVMHKNDFCQSCHLMDTAWNRFQVTAHKDLQCHACHRQPLIASSKEVFYWVFERRMAIPAHDKVPTTVCSECHLRTATDSARTNVLLTAGHVVHLQSDSSALKNVQCVTCHGHDFHMFKPNNAACTQSGCHSGVKVQLGAMSQAAFLHCTTCHAFKGSVPRGADEATGKGGVTPAAKQCGSCHEMSAKMASWDLEADPHKGTCGMCHNPHKQTVPADAFKSCATAQCHASADTLTALHRGLGSHTLGNCGACHQAHSWRVKGSDCVSCHKAIFNDKPPARRPGDAPSDHGAHGGVASADAAPRPHRQAPPEPVVAREISIRLSPRPLDRRRTMTRAHRRSMPSVRRAGRAARAPDVWFEVAVRTPATPRTATQRPQGTSALLAAHDSAFLHSRHRAIVCTTCHSTTGTHGALKITRPQGCLACHHRQDQTVACATCHAQGPTGAFARAVTFRVSARPDATKSRTVMFPHARHGTLDCVRCHGADARRTVVAACDDCHADHHQVDRDCASCHVDARTGHARSAHDGCAACHSRQRFAPAQLTRPICLACHQDQKDHYPPRDCAACHAVPDHAHAGDGANR